LRKKYLAVPVHKMQNLKASIKGHFLVFRGIQAAETAFNII
jgi:hypothetical protein